ncbi:MAG: DinB family protein [Acidobacteriota bacterium]|nr:DinB family protein [Acidobacteriota bacterium]
MTDANIGRPDAAEYPSYYSGYISLVPEGQIVETLSRQLDATLSLLRGISDVQSGSRYAPGKWSVKELVGHIIDSERVFAYRALSFARGDQTPLPGFEQDDYVKGGNSDECLLRDLAEEFEHVRRANLLLFRQLKGDAWLRRGVANNGEISVRALAYIIAGHELHHLNILRTKYL